MFECFNCLNKSVVWMADYDAEDYGYEGTGVVHVLQCQHCGAEITYVVMDKEEEEE